MRFPRKIKTSSESFNGRRTYRAFVQQQYNNNNNNSRVSSAIHGGPRYVHRARVAHNDGFRSFRTESAAAIYSFVTRLFHSPSNWLTPGWVNLARLKHI